MLLELRDLSVSYGKAVALENVTMQVDAGEFVAVLGPNGAGKSTLLKAISRAQPSIGVLKLRGESLQGLPAHAVVGKGISHCPEGRRLFPELTVLKNVMLGAYLRRDTAAVAADLEQVYGLFPILRDREQQVVSTLSGGQQQMVAIGRALMARPRIVLFDEPSLGLAPTVVDDMFEIIARVRDEGTAVLLVEQNVLKALDIADRAYVLEQGRIVAQGLPADLLKQPQIREAYLGV